MFTFRNYIDILSKHFAMTAAMLAVLFYCACWLTSYLYYQQFGIDFSSFSSLSDVYRLPFTQLSYFIFVVLFVPGIVFVGAFLCLDVLGELAFGNDLTFLKRAGLVAKGIVIAATLSFFVWVLMVQIPGDYESRMLAGRSARVNITLEDSVHFRCVSVIGSSSAYLFVINHPERSVSAIPQQLIRGIQFVIAAPPVQGQGKHRKPDNIFEKEIGPWNQELGEKCGQSIVQSTVDAKHM